MLTSYVCIVFFNVLGEVWGPLFPPAERSTCIFTGRNTPKLNLSKLGNGKRDSFGGWKSTQKVSKEQVVAYSNVL